MKLYKVLDAGGRSCNGGKMEWSLPTQNEDGTWTPGDWAPEIEGDLESCKNGYHVTDFEHLLLWIHARVFEVEVSGDVLESGDKYVCRRCRLTREVIAWNDRSARLFACDCAERVLSLFERVHPYDGQPRLAIETARRFAVGEAGTVELAAARDAASAASAAWIAASAAAGAAARDAASAAAGAAARDAASAAGAAASAAWIAARAAAGAAAGAAASAAGAAAEEWQTNKLQEYLKEEE